MISLKRRGLQSLKLDVDNRKVLASRINVLTCKNGAQLCELSSPMQIVSNATRPCSRQRSIRRRSRQTRRASSRCSRRTNSAASRRNIPGALLPMELLIRIFLLGSLSDPEFPVIISQVCSLWRRLAIHTPKLWCYIRPDGRYCMSARRLKRARSQLLDIDLRFPSASPTNTSLLIAKIHSRMRSIYPFIRQWRLLSICFSGYAPFLWNVALSGLCAQPSHRSCHVTQLEELLLKFPMNDDTKEFLLFGNEAPRLRRLTLCGIRLKWTSSLFGNLISLDYTHHGFNEGYSAIREILNMLTISYRLETLTIAFSADHEDRLLFGSAQSMESTTMPRLKTLVFSIVGTAIPDEVGLLALNLHLPSLTRLELVAKNAGHSIRGEDIMASLQAFHGHTRVRVLCLRVAQFDCRCMSAFVNSLPDLRHFIVAGNVIPVECIRR